MANEKEIAKETDEKKPEPQEVKMRKSACCGNHSPLTAILIVVAIVAVVGLAFAAGRIGSGRLESNRMGRVQNTMMSGRGFGQRQMMGKKDTREFAGVRASGTVSAINDSNITIKTSSKDVTVIVDDQTSYLNAGQIAKATDLQVNDTVVAVGQSNAAGEIAADLVQIR